MKIHDINFCIYTPCTFLCYMLHGITDKVIKFFIFQPEFNIGLSLETLTSSY